MNKNNRLFRIAISAGLSTLMAGAAVCVLFAALQMPCSAAAAYLTALAAAALCGLATVSGPMAILAAAGGFVLLGGAAMAHSEGFGQIPTLWAALTDSAAQTAAAEWTEACALLGMFLPVFLAAVLFALVHYRGGTAFALLVELAVIIGSYALSPALPLWMAVPGLIAALAAFALSGEPARDGGAWRALLPAAIAVCAALAFVPKTGTVWEPMQKAADRVRAAFEDYFRFTEERVPFTISTEGYDHAAEVDGNVVSQLGGPATPDPEEVMRVTADAGVLLRGSIRRTYTGHAWVDNDPKARYLYYDFTRRGVRESVFGMDGNDALAPVQVSVEMLSEGTSTLFVPGRLADFSMDRDTAVYYNSIGEMFLSRTVAPGDSYSLIGYRTPDAETLRRVAAAAQEKADGDYAGLLQSCTQLPEGIEDGVYALTMELTQGAESPADKALAIQNWLRNNCVYTLSPGYPDDDRDFVSQFLLETREGYCSYFASAMTVMCRIAGLPARYVEGYSVRTDGEPVIVTGENAHAWTEVYFSGLGWVAFDTANGAGGGSDGVSGETNSSDELANETEAPESGDPGATLPPDGEETLPPDDGTGEPTPTPQATLPPDGEPELDPTPSPTPDSDGWGSDAPTPQPSGLPDNPQTSPNPPDAQQDSPEKSRTWIWVLLGILLLLLIAALAALLIRRRLDGTDPIRLSGQEADSQTAVLILYRSLLTLLQCAGQAPLSGETPSAFARRVCAQAENRDFEEFARAVERQVYARGEADGETVALGQRVYAALLAEMRRSERLRFVFTRLTRGLGGFDAIP